MPFVTRLPALTGSDPYPDALLALDFVGARRGPQYYKSGGVTTADITKIPGWTYTGGTPAGTGSYAPKADGSLQFFPSYTNLLTYSEQFDNAAWTKFAAPITADAIAAPTGTTTADKMTPTAASSLHYMVQSITNSTGQFTSSVYAKSAGYTKFRLNMTDNATGSVYGSVDLTAGTVAMTSDGTWTGGSASIQALSNGCYRVTVTGTRVSGTSTALRIDAQDASGNLSFTGDGTSGIYIWGAQLELGSTASTYIPTTTAAVTVAAPRITDAGYLAEEARTNSIRNNTMAGAVAGTPGTAPTNWAVSQNANGLSIQLVGTGTDSVTGAPYVEYRFFGTTTGSQGITIQFETATAIAATNGQAWTLSTYVAVVAGSTSGFVSGPKLQFGMMAGGGAYISGSSASSEISGSSMTRASVTFTTNQATTAFVQPYIIATPGTGKTVDFTLRVSLPQMELGSFATSPIPTTSVAVTRAADVGYISGLTASTNYTLMATGSAQYVSGSFPGTVSLSIGSSTSNEMTMATTDGGYSGTRASMNLRVGGTIVGSLQLTTAGTPGELMTIATAVTPSATAGTGKGQAATTSTSGTLAWDRLSVGTRGSGALAANGPIRRIVIYPRAMSNAELQAITTAGAY